MAIAVKDKEQEPETRIVHVAPMDEITRFVHANSNLSLEQMPAEYKESGRYDLPVIDPTNTRTLTLGQGREKPIPIDIGWQNRKKFNYKWLTMDEARKPQFMGYRPVVKDCPANYAGGKAIPDSYYAGKDYIGVGAGHILHWSVIGYSDGLKAAGRNRALGRLESLKPGHKSVDVADGEGSSAGNIKTTGFDAKGFTEE